MKTPLILTLTLILTPFLGACSVAGKENVEMAPYKVIEAQEQPYKIELREYDSLVLVSTPMKIEGQNSESRNSAFSRLFKYISGDNIAQQEIPMTAPVFMDEEPQGQEIPMTAPVFMDEGSDTPMMSFVMPLDMKLSETPVPKNPAVSVSELKNYKVAAIIFSGRLSDSNVEKHKEILQAWVQEKGLSVNGGIKKAGYNSPFSLPMFRRNEVLIPVK